MDSLGDSRHAVRRELASAKIGSPVGVGVGLHPPLGDALLIALPGLVRVLLQAPAAHTVG